MLFRYHISNLKHYAGNLLKNMEQKSKLIFEIEPEDAAPQALIVFPDCSTETEDRILKVRLDKWLWAARFFKTAALARSAVEHGKVSYNDEKLKLKPSREIELGATLSINLGKYKKKVIIRKLSTRRCNAERASELFDVVASNLYESEGQLEFTEEKRPRKMVRFLRRSVSAPELIK